LPAVRIDLDRAIAVVIDGENRLSRQVVVTPGETATLGFVLPRAR